MTFKIIYENCDDWSKCVVYAHSLDINKQDMLILDGGRFVIPQAQVIKIELE